MDEKKIKKLYDSDDIKKAKLLKPFKFRLSPGKKSDYYINTLKPYNDVVVIGDCMVKFNPGSIFNKGEKNESKNISLSIGITNLYDSWIVKFISDFQEGVYKFVYDKVMSKKIKTNMIANVLNFKPSIPCLYKNKNEEDINREYIKGIKVPCYKKGKYADDPKIIVVTGNQKPNKQSSRIKITNYDLTMNLSKSYQCGQNSDEYKKAVKNWKDFNKIEWKHSTINKYISAGTHLKYLGIQLKGGYVNKEMTVPQIQAKYIYYCDSNENDINDPINTDEIFGYINNFEKDSNNKKESENKGKDKCNKKEEKKDKPIVKKDDEKKNNKSMFWIEKD